MNLGRCVKLEAATLLDLAERASEFSVGRWSLALLRHAFPEAPSERLLALPIGARDRLVLSIRDQLLSTPFRSEPVCAECGKPFELNLDLAAFGLAGNASWPSPAPQTVRIQDRELQLRAVNLGDLLAVETVAEPNQAVRVLAQRVLGENESDLPLADLSEALEALDPAADIWLETACPECGTKQPIAFDPVHYVAHEIRQLSRQILRDVVEIARVFHWSEHDILALPEQRRAYYVAEALA